MASWGAAQGKGASCHLQLCASVSLVGIEITPSPGRAGRGEGRRRESQASRGRDSGFLPSPATPGGHRGSLGPLPSVCGLMCSLGGGSQEVAAPERKHRLLGGAGSRSASSGWAQRGARPRATRPQVREQLFPSNRNQAPGSAPGRSTLSPPLVRAAAQPGAE